jgi:hypothetical protein
MMKKIQEINSLYLEINKKEYDKCKIENGNFYPVINTFYFLHTFTKITKESIDLYKQFDLFCENVDSTLLKTKAVLNFIHDISDTSLPIDSIEKRETELVSNSLTENISYVPFVYNKKPFISTWLSHKFLPNEEQIVFLELTKPIERFIDSTHKIWYISPQTKEKEIFIDYAKDITYSNNVIFTNNGFFYKSPKRKITFVF